MRHEGKGFKRPLSMGLLVASCGSTTLSAKIKVDGSGRRRNRSGGNPERLSSGANRGPSFCCGCRRWRGSTTLRLAGGIVGIIHVLGFLACPCRGFAPTRSGAGLLPSQQRAGHCDRRSTDRTARIQALRCTSYGAAGERGHEERRRRRRQPRDRRGNSRSAGVFDAMACSATTRLRGAEEGWPLGLLYDRALLKEGGAFVVAEAAASCSRNGVVASGELAAGAAAAAAAAAGSYAKEGDATMVEADLFESSGGSPSERSMGGNMTTARWAHVVNGGGMTSVSPVQRGPTPPAGQDATTATTTTTTTTAPVTKRKWSGKGWLGIGASWRAGEGWSGPSKTDTALQASSMLSMTTTGVTTPSRETVPQSDSPVDEVFAAAVEEAGGRRGNGTDCSPTGMTVSPAASLTTTTTMTSSSEWSWEERSLEGGYEKPTRRASTLERRRERRSWRVWQGPERQRRRAMEAGLLIARDEEEEEYDEDEEDGEEEEDVCATAREELTVYLLETGATHYEVATAASALFAMEPELALTQLTWRRWRQNLEGLRSTGFTGGGLARGPPFYLFSCALLWTMFFVFCLFRRVWVCADHSRGA